MGARHALHLVIGAIIKDDEFPGCSIRRAPECGGTHNLPLFYTARKSNATEFTDVDMLILKNRRIRVIIEIEEKQFNPRLLFGKVVAAAVCWGYIYDPSNEDARMGERVAFVQIVSSSGLSSGSSKPRQWDNVEEAIHKIMPLKGYPITDYKLLHGESADFRGAEGGRLLEHLQRVVRS